MREVTVLLHFAAPMERVFDAVSDHESFIRGGGAVTRVTREGTPERNGLGCVREVRAGGAKILEEVTAWERPARYEYVVRKPRTVVHHEYGSVELMPRGSGTDVRWTTRYEVAVPVVGGAVEGMLEGLFRYVFTRFLTDARARVEGDKN